MKVIGVDLRCLPLDGSAGAGVAHAARELAKQLIIKQKTSNFELIFYVPNGARWEGGRVVKLADNSGRSLRRALKSQSCDLLFVPGGSIAPSIHVPTIPWVHDLIIFEHSEWFNQNRFKRLLTKSLFAYGVKKARIIFTVSDYTKQKLIEHLKIDASKIVVTGEGGDPELAVNNKEEIQIKKIKAKEFCEKELNLIRPFVLCLGTVEPRKNIAMLIQAWKNAKQKSAETPDLVVAGEDGWKYADVDQEIKTMNSAENQSFYRLRNLLDEEKRQLLLAAEMVAIPSLDEGFGLVALEAMQAGTPFAVSDAGALPEVAGQAGMLVHPQDTDAWSSAIMTCMDDKRACDLRTDLGLVQSKQWTWENTANIVIQGLSECFD